MSSMSLVNWGIDGVNCQMIGGKLVVPNSEQRSADTDYGKKTGAGKVLTGMIKDKIELWSRE